MTLAGQRRGGKQTERTAWGRRRGWGHKGHADQGERVMWATTVSRPTIITPERVARRVTQRRTAVVTLKADGGQSTLSFLSVLFSVFSFSRTSRRETMNTFLGSAPHRLLCFAYVSLIKSKNIRSMSRVHYRLATVGHQKIPSAEIRVQSN